MDRRTTILLTVADAALDLLAHDRKDDEDLREGEIEAAINGGEITADEIVAEFRRALTECLS